MAGEIPVKIALFVHSLGAGGAERQVILLASALLEKGHEVELFLIHHTIFYDMPDNLKITVLDDAPLHLHPIKKLLKLLPLAKKYADLCQADISLSFMNRPNYINVLSKFFGNRARIIVAERAASRFQFKGIEAPIAHLLIRTLYPQADLIVANSQGNAQDLQTHFGIQNVVAIPNAFDLKKIAHLSTEPIEREVEEKMKNFSFITVGRIDAGKNHHLLIEALAKSGLSAHLFIIGDGPERKNLETSIVRLGLEKRVHLLGKKKNPFAYMARADCFVFGSNHEGFPNVLVEAMACGLPVISTDCPFGPAEILDGRPTYGLTRKNIHEGQYGILVPMNDIDIMASAMEKVYNNTQFKDAYATLASQRAKHYELAPIMRMWMSLINQPKRPG